MKCDELFVVHAAAWCFALISSVGRTELRQMSLMVSVLENFATGRAPELYGIQKAFGLRLEFNLLTCKVILAYSTVITRELLSALPAKVAFTHAAADRVIHYIVTLGAYEDQVDAIHGLAPLQYPIVIGDEGRVLLRSGLSDQLLDHFSFQVMAGQLTWQ